MISGFRKAGIWPIDRSQVVRRLPQKPPSEDVVQQTVSLVSDSVLDMLKELRQGSTDQPKRRRTKINVEAGKSIQVEDLLVNNKETTFFEAENGQTGTQFDLSDVEHVQSAGDVSENDQVLDLSETETTLAGSLKKENSPRNSPPNFKVNDFVIVKFTSPKIKHSIGKIVQIHNENVAVKMFSKIRNKFVEVDASEILPFQIIKTISSPVTTRRGFTFNELDCINITIE